MRKEQIENILTKLFEYIDNCPEEKLIRLGTIDGFVIPNKNIKSDNNKIP